jgi:hypothetical protein
MGKDDEVASFDWSATDKRTLPDVAPKTALCFKAGQRGSEHRAAQI